MERIYLTSTLPVEKDSRTIFGSLDLREDGFLKDAANPSNDAKISQGIGSSIYPIKEVNDGQQRLTTIFSAFSAIASIKEQGGDSSYVDSLSKNHSFFVQTTDDKSGRHHGDRIMLQEQNLTKHLRKLVVEGDGLRAIHQATEKKE